jgi:release factor glutamine methyltransferase
MEAEVEWLLKEKYGGRESEAFAADVERLKSGEPLAYVIGFVSFLNTKIYLDSRPLIPRPETEYWVEKAIADIKKSKIEAPKVLDLCAGSGCIGVAVAKAIPDARVDFAEIDERHHETIKKNLQENATDTARIRIFGGDLFERLAAQYDYILTNPPYVDPALDRVEKSVKDFEPHVALYGGANGLRVIERIICDASLFLARRGVLIIEHEPEQQVLMRTFAQRNGFALETKGDQFGIKRYSILKTEFPDTQDA